MPEYLHELLADGATALVNESFTGVKAPWWWERRLGGGIAVCQILDPTSMARNISARIDNDIRDIERATEEELGLEDLEPVVLTFEIPGDTTVAEAAHMLAERSATQRGLAAGLYSQVEQALG